MTKQQILKKHSQKFDQDIYGAMDEYTKQEAIAFVEWLDAGFYLGSGEWQIEGDSKVIPPGNYKTEELYNLYLQSK